MSRIWRQTISDELAELIDARRGPLSLQEYTTFVLAAACEGQTLAQRIAELERQVAELRRGPAGIVVGPANTDGMLSFD